MGERGDRQIPGAFNQVMMCVFLVNIKDALHNCASTYTVILGEG